MSGLGLVRRRVDQLGPRSTADPDPVAGVEALKTPRNTRLPQEKPHAFKRSRQPPYPLKSDRSTSVILGRGLPEPDFAPSGVTNTLDRRVAGIAGPQHPRPSPVPILRRWTAEAV